jgi:hypothetical protein
MLCVALGKSIILLMLCVAVGKSLDVVCSLGQITCLLMWCDCVAALDKSLDVVCRLGQVT